MVRLSATPGLEHCDGQSESVAGCVTDDLHEGERFRSTFYRMLSYFRVPIDVGNKTYFC